MAMLNYHNISSIKNSYLVAIMRQILRRAIDEENSFVRPCQRNADAERM